MSDKLEIGVSGDISRNTPVGTISVSANVNNVLNTNSNEAYESIKDISCPYFLQRYSGKMHVKPEISMMHLAELKKMLVIIFYNPELEFRPSDQLRNAWEILILETQEYMSICEKLGGYIHYGGERVLQSKANENFRTWYPQIFGDMQDIWSNTDIFLIHANQESGKEYFGKAGW